MRADKRKMIQCLVLGGVLLAGCDQFFSEDKLCENEAGTSCCSIETGPGAYVSSCESSSRACSELANAYPKSGEYPIATFPAPNVDTQTRGCR